MAEDELQEDRRRTIGCFGGEGRAQGIPEELVRPACAEAEGEGTHGDLCTVSVGEERIADRPCGEESGLLRVGGFRKPVEYPVGDGGEERLLILEVPVQGAGLYAELRGKPTHAEIGEADLIEQPESRRGDALAIVACRGGEGVHDLSILNGVQVNTVQEGTFMTTTATGARELARIAVFAALIIVLGMVSVPLAGGVPVTGQTLGVMLAGTVLGARKGALSVLVVLALAAVGLPVLAGGRGGITVFVGPTAGYLLGWVVGVVVVGLIARGAERRLRWWRVTVGVLVGGIPVIYLFGIPVQALVVGTDLGTTVISSLAFLPGDLLKAAIAIAVTFALQRAYPPAFGLPQQIASTVGGRA